MCLEGKLDVTVRGGDVEFTFTVTNAGSEPVELTFRSGFVADFVVYDDDAEVWRFSDGRMFTQALQTETLTPGEEFVSTTTWEDPEPGTYEAVGTLQMQNANVNARAKFEI